jgi:hypothetical protein
LVYTCIKIGAMSVIGYGLSVMIDARPITNNELPITNYR